MIKNISVLGAGTMGHANESISFPPNEGRGLANKTNEVAEMLVIINYPDAK